MMMRLILIVICCAAVAFAQRPAETKTTKLEKLTVAGSLDCYAVNGTLVRNLGDLNGSPSWMKGCGWGAEVKYPVFTRHIGLYANYGQSSVSGNGPWEPKSDN